MPLAVISTNKKKASQLKRKNRLVMLLSIIIYIIIYQANILPEEFILILFAITACICISMIANNRKYKKKNDVISIYSDGIAFEDNVGRITNRKWNEIKNFSTDKTETQILIHTYIQSRGQIIWLKIPISFEATTLNKNDIRNLANQLENYRISAC